VYPRTRPHMNLYSGRGYAEARLHADTLGALARRLGMG
jgi:hypothetical protein